MSPCDIAAHHSEECGNSYCGSLYAGLLSLIANKADDLTGRRVMLFSYGSGLAATLFSINVKGDVRPIRDTANVHSRLAARTRVSPKEFTSILEKREEVRQCPLPLPHLSSTPSFLRSFLMADVHKVRLRAGPARVRARPRHVLPLPRRLPRAPLLRPRAQHVRPRCPLSRLRVPIAHCPRRQCPRLRCRRHCNATHMRTSWSLIFIRGDLGHQ